MDLATFNARVTHGQAVVVEARRQLRYGSWTPTDLERQVAYLLFDGAGPMVNLEPDPPLSSIWGRTRRVSAWSSRLRLAMLAVGWQEPDHVADAAIPDPMQLADLLTAMWQIGVMIEPWAEELRCHYRPLDGAVRFIADHPEAYSAIETAEEIFDEPANILELLDEICTGRLRAEAPAW